MIPNCFRGKKKTDNFLSNIRIFSLKTIILKKPPNFISAYFRTGKLGKFVVFASILRQVWSATKNRLETISNYEDVQPISKTNNSFVSKKSKRLGLTLPPLNMYILSLYTEASARHLAQ